jgi:hypothetical protein
MAAASAPGGSRLLAGSRARRSRETWIGRAFLAAALVSVETPGVRKTAPRKERALTSSVATMRRAREPLLGRQVRMTWIWSR